MPLDPDLTTFNTVGGSVVTFTWTEFASNTGYQVFNLADAAGSLYFLTTQTPYSDLGYSTGVIDTDFDILIQKAITTRGDAIITVPLMHHNNTGGAKNIQTKTTVTVRHWDGTTETGLGTDDNTETSPAMAAAGTEEFIQTFKITLTEKHFAEGETLRVTIATDNTGTTGGTQYIAHDPANRLPAIPGGTSTLSKSSANIPFKVEV